MLKDDFYCVTFAACFLPSPIVLGLVVVLVLGLLVQPWGGVPRENEEARERFRSDMVPLQLQGTSPSIA